jgi:hypothetical protein
MSRILKILLACGVGLAAVVALLSASGQQPSAAQPDPLSLYATGFLNPGFEGTYVDSDGSGERDVAPDWELWYFEWPDEEPLIDPPKAEEETSVLLEGDKAQRVSGKDSGHNFDACVYQQVSGITVGHYIRFTVWGKVDASSSLNLQDYQTRVGIDPTGGTDPRDIQYELHPDLWDPYTQADESWQEMSVGMKAISETVTLYACAHPRYAYRFEVVWDQASFSVLPERLSYMPLVLHRYFVPPSPGTLWNPDLELDWGEKNGYQLPIDGYTNVYVAPYWMPFWNDNFITSTGEFRQPEYNYADRDYRVHHGGVSQQYGLSAWGGFEAGIYQVISGTVPSDTVRFSIWGLGWSSNSSGANDRYSDVREGLNFRVGIDPYGGQSYTSTDVIWSDLYDPYDEWHSFEITATVQSSQISVWAYAYPTAYWIRFNQVFWDDANLTVLESP